MFCSLNKNSGVKVCVIIAVFMTIYGLVNSYCSTIMRFEENKSRSVEMKTRWTQDDYRFTIENGEWGESLPFHPFENTCKFPLPNTYASDIATWGLSERLRVRNCPVEDFDFASMDNEGAMYVHPHYTEYPNVASDIKCKVVFLDGALRNKTTNQGKDNLIEVSETDVPENTRFFVNADAFYIRCFNKSNIKVFESVFPGMRDLNKRINTIFVVEDTPSFDSYGRKRKALKREKPQRLSIDILGFDSTSRTMFYRHLPRTLETMNRLGYETLYGYNKVGDNSMVNLGPILIGDVPEALTEPMLDESGDINSNWILPANKKMDPTALRFLWKLMKEKYGCRSMLNEDISRKELGLFHYPLNEFLPGFTEPPADHFYRAYYLAVYKNWSYGSCRDGRQIQRQFVDLWRRFAVRYKDICHFGFTFVTTLSHEVGFLLELLDEHISSSLENLLTVGALDNTVSVVMGDHGNRIGLAQYSYTGRIEERMPLMAIRFPPWFRSKYREEYNNFRENRWKLTSNFDVHQTLKDIALMRLGTNRSLITSGGRGISLFDKIPDSRTCRDAYIPENFCTCLVDRTAVKKPFNNINSKSVEHRIKASLEAVRNWIIATNLSTCIDEKSVIIKGKLTTLGLNPLARHGLRSKSNVTVVRDARRKEAKLDFFHHEFEAVAIFRSYSKQSIRLLFRVDENVLTEKFQVVFEPSVRVSPVICRRNSLFDVCDCLAAEKL